MKIYIKYLRENSYSHLMKVTLTIYLVQKTINFH